MIDITQQTCTNDIFRDKNKASFSVSKPVLNARLDTMYMYDVMCV